MTSERLSPPRPLDADDDVAAFHCGTPPLDTYLKRFALEHQRSGTSRTYVAIRGEHVVAYYTLAPGSVAPAEAPQRVRKGQGASEVPVILLARLAVDTAEQGRGIGRHMLLDALLRAVRAADVIGGRAVLVHAKDDRTRQFYAKHGFEPSPTDALHLFVLMKDLRKTLDL